jgi:protein tyrosine/serine phosphatase
MTTRAQQPARRRLVLSFLAAFTALTFAWNAQAVTISPQQAGITNFGQVNENYFRGAQPSQPAIERLHALGIKTVIDLQEQPVGDESAWAKAAGMQYFNIPLNGSRPATDEQTARFLELVNDPKNLPVYVHCKVGKHRTGAMTAIYRITHDTWTADQAFAEMKTFGWYSFPNHGALKTHMYGYYDTHRAALAARAPATTVESSRVASSSDVVSAPTP